MSALHEASEPRPWGDVRPVVVPGDSPEDERARVRAILEPRSLPVDVLPETPLVPSAAAALDALVESGMTVHDAVNWVLQLGDDIAAHISAGGTVLLTDPDGTSVHLKMPT